MSFPFTSGPHRLLAQGCEAHGCASPADTWPLYQVMTGGVRSSLCSSCVLLCHRSLYCCRCFLLFPRASQTGHYDDGDHLIAPPGLPTVTCKVCRAAAAHAVCLPAGERGGDFVCPACSAKAVGGAFTYAPRSGTPIRREGARVLVVAARMALAMQRREAAAARAAAERAAREAAAARMSMVDALGPFIDESKGQEASWSTGTGMDMDMDTPPAAELQLPLALEACRLVTTGSTSAPAQSNAPAPAGKTSGARGAATEPTMVVPAVPSPAPPRRLQLFGVNVLERPPASEAAKRGLAPTKKMQPVGGANEVATSAATPRPPPTRPLQRLRIREEATAAAAAAEAARASPAPPPLFPTRPRSSSRTRTAWTQWWSKGKGKAPVVEVDDDDDDM
ncbi:hypothetical protein ACP4OV_021034 [Aristida adscensionis]